MSVKKFTHRQLSAPATKEDIVLVMDSIGKHYDATERWKNEILEHMSQWKQEVIEQTNRHFDVKCEELTHDFQGALKDKISVHDDHLKRHDQAIRAVRMHVGMRP